MKKNIGRNFGRHLDMYIGKNISFSSYFLTIKTYKKICLNFYIIGFLFNMIFFIYIIFVTTKRTLKKW